MYNDPLNVKNVLFISQSLGIVNVDHIRLFINLKIPKNSIFRGEILKFYVSSFGLFFKV